MESRDTSDSTGGAAMTHTADPYRNPHDVSYVVDVERSKI